MIQDSPIYNMSMCSLENFHTCFLKWLGKIYPNETLKIFIPEETTNNINFENQERFGNKYIFDLYVTMGNNKDKILVIENKLKAFPTEEQLTNYQKSLANRQAKFILLSLAPKVKLPKGWNYLSYSELAKNMHFVFDNANFKEEYHKSLVKDYISVIENLSDNFPKNSSLKYDIYDEKICNDLRDLYIKYRISELSNYINEKTKLTSDTDFRNKYGIINIWQSFEGFDITFLIQIQHNQYRYCMIYGNDKDEKLRESIATSIAEQKIWFNNCIENYPKARNYKSGKFCGYGTRFIYRYQTLEKLFNKNNLSNITYKEILDKVNNDISELKNNKHKIIRIVIDSLGKF